MKNLIVITLISLVALLLPSESNATTNKVVCLLCQGEGDFKALAIASGSGRHVIVNPETEKTFAFIVFDDPIECLQVQYP